MTQHSPKDAGQLAASGHAKPRPGPNPQRSALSKSPGAPLGTNLAAIAESAGGSDPGPVDTPKADKGI